jgi:hypothetical protein
MKKRVSINIFLFSSLVILILVLIRIGAAEKILNIVTERINSDENISEDYPEYIYETFVDGNGDEVSVKMEKKTGTLDGEEVVFYEDTIGSEVIFCNFYKGIIKEINNGKLIKVFIDKHLIDAELDSSFRDYIDVEDYDKSFDINDYNLSNLNDFGFRDMVSFNTEEISSFSELHDLINEYIRIQDVLFKDSLTGKKYKALNFFSK